MHAIKAVNSNNGFFMCSNTDSTTPKKHGHVSDDARVTAKSCCSPTCLFSVCSNLVPSTQPFRVHRGANTCLLAGTSTQTYARCQQWNRMTPLCASHPVYVSADTFDVVGSTGGTICLTDFACIREKRCCGVSRREFLCIGEGCGETAVHGSVDD